MTVSTIPGVRKTRMGTSRPKITTLMEEGRIKPEQLNPKTGMPFTPESPTEMRVIIKDGVKVEVPVSRGYVRNPDNPKWRIGLTPEKYLAKISAELDFELRKGRRERVAPDLYPEEVEDFLSWLESYVASDPVDGVPEHPTLKRYLKEIERRTAKKTKKVAGKKESSPAPDAAV